MNDARTIAGHLLNQDILAAVPVAGGGNNRVYRITAEGGVYALKFYPSEEEDQRDRLRQEFAALKFMTANGIDCVPTPVSADRNLCCGIYEWIDGAEPGAPSEIDIDAVLGLVETLNGLAETEVAVALAPASESCLSGEEITRQIDGRFRRLTTVADEHPELSHFLTEEFSPALKTLTARARRAYKAMEGAFADEIEKTLQTLNPSDFGFHNTLRKQDGEIVFLDFEYFGWDDPVKLVSDFLLHPGHALSDQAGGRFLRGAGSLFGADAGFARRLSALYPLYGLRWCLIILAEFLPERMKRRQIAGRHAEPGKARQDQLKKAQKLLNQLMASGGDLPYGN